MGIEEALQVSAPGGNLQIEVALRQACGDADADGDLDRDDAVAFRACLQAPNPSCGIFDINLDGNLDAADARALRNRIVGPGGTASSPYLVEMVVRSDP